MQDRERPEIIDELYSWQAYVNTVASTLSKGTLMQFKQVICIASAIFLSGLGTQRTYATTIANEVYANIDDPPAWKSCQRIENPEKRLTCFDEWGRQQTAKVATPNNAPPTDAATTVIPPSRETSAIAESGNCRNKQYSALSRFWELEAGTDCGTLSLRGYRPLNVSLSTTTDRPKVEDATEGENSTYQATEARIALSLRTKLAQNLLTDNDASHQDSLWFGYSQQSTWQLFNENMSRPFRTTDHEPEIMYVYPTTYSALGNWQVRYMGVGAAHHSNGESEPLSRSWNRVYLMSGAELDDRFQINGRLWKRISEDSENDDNPDIANYIGRAEITGRGNYDLRNIFDATLRNNLRGDGRGSLRLEWFRTIGDSDSSNLRLHTQLFHGYGDTLIEYNRRRTVFSIGLSLVDF
ncbi:phospholipase A [Pseudomonas chengduensis]